MDQLSFASLDFAAKKKRTKRDVFLAEMSAGGTVEGAARVDRAALSQGKDQTRCTTAAGNRCGEGSVNCTEGYA